MAFNVSPLNYNFGNVELGKSSTTIVTISNIGSGIHMVSGVSIRSGSLNSDEFSTISFATLPANLLPLKTMDVEIRYTPTLIGPSSAVLDIMTDSNEPTIEVTLSGTCAQVEAPPKGQDEKETSPERQEEVEIPPQEGNGEETPAQEQEEGEIPPQEQNPVIPPQDQIAQLLAFFDASIEDGSLEGNGPGNSAPNRLHALRNMIEAAGNLMENNSVEEACQQLQDAYNRTDGQSNPPDFVKGTGTGALADQILNLMATLGCEQ